MTVTVTIHSSLKNAPPLPTPTIELPLTMPPKRSGLQSPNPVKHQMVAPEDLVVDETVAEVELIVQVAEYMEAQDVADAAAAEEISTALPVTPPRNAEPTYIYVYMPPKRSHLQFPNPVKQEMVAPDHLVVDEAVAEVELIVQVAENMEEQ